MVDKESLDMKNHQYMYLRELNVMIKIIAINRLSMERFRYFLTAMM